MFTQHWFMTRLEFDILSDGVSVKESDLTSSRSYRVAFENIPAEPSIVKLASKPRLWATAGLGLLAIIIGLVDLAGNDIGGDFLFFAGASIVAGLTFLASRREYLVFHGGNPALVVLRNRPTPEAQAAFIKEMQDRKHAYLTQRYLLGTQEASAVDALHKLAWLREQGVVSAIEFESLKSDIVHGKPPSAPPGRFEH